LLADLYEQRGDPQSALCCLERAVRVGRHYDAAQSAFDLERIARLQPGLRAQSQRDAQADRSRKYGERQQSD
jgi:hypothetical protein